MYHDQTDSGKGDRPRISFNKKKFDMNMDRIFPPKIIKTWNPEEDETQEENPKNISDSKDRETS